MNCAGNVVAGGAPDRRGRDLRARAAAARQGRRHGRGVRQRLVGQPVRRRRLGQLPVAHHGDPRGGILRCRASGSPISARTHGAPQGVMQQGVMEKMAPKTSDVAAAPRPGRRAAPAPPRRRRSRRGTEATAPSSRQRQPRRTSDGGSKAGRRAEVTLTSRRGGIGRHAVLRGQWRKPWEFESPRRHQNAR